jgi:hypothetical protein
MSGGHTPEQLFRFERELAENPKLVDRVLTELPAVEGREVVTIRCDAASIDAAVARALALAVRGIESHLELSE